MATNLGKSSCNKSKDGLDVVSLLSDKVKGMTELREEMFDLKVTVPALNCPRKSCGYFQKELRRLFLNRRKFCSIIEDNDNLENRIILLNPSLIKNEQDFNEHESAALAGGKAKFFMHELHLSYVDFSFDEIMKMILPEDVDDTVTSFETVGHIAHLNLKETLLKYKNVIGEVLLNKNPNIKTVVNKTSTIEDAYRFFSMELLAGENDMNAKLIEHGSIFEFDYSKVYWNSRLQTEHNRIVSLTEKGDIIYDVFAGVGPFAIPAAKKGCIVYANDLNKNSYESLRHNAKLNKVTEFIHAYNLDGREFLETIVIEGLFSEHQNNHPQNMPRKHILMNLPSIAVQFLDVFRFNYDHFDLPLRLFPDVTIHCYLFSKSKTPHLDAETIISAALGLDMTSHCKTHFVRRVAPNKIMMCASFKLIWFEKEAEKCSCYASATPIIGRKRPLEGGLNPILVEKPKRTLPSD